MASLSQAGRVPNPRVQYAEGLMYLNGEAGVEKNATKAVELFKQAAKQGFGKAQTTLSLMYLKVTPAEHSTSEVLVQAKLVLQHTAHAMTIRQAMTGAIRSGTT